MADRFGTAIPDDWAAVVDRTDDERLNRAFLALRQKCPTFVPKLGEFEACIPRKLFGEDSIPDRLAQAVLKRFNLCEHQLWQSWTYFGKNVSGAGQFYQETAGVVVPGCDGCGRSSHRLLVEDL